MSECGGGGEAGDGQRRGSGGQREAEAGATKLAMRSVRQHYRRAQVGGPGISGRPQPPTTRRSKLSATLAVLAWLPDGCILAISGTRLARCRVAGVECLVELGNHQQSSPHARSGDLRPAAHLHHICSTPAQHLQRPCCLPCPALHTTVDDALTAHNARNAPSAPVMTIAVEMHMCQQT